MLVSPRLARTCFWWFYAKGVDIHGSCRPKYVKYVFREKAYPFTYVFPYIRKDKFTVMEFCNYFIQDTWDRALTYDISDF